MRLYLDTSALVPLVISEPSTPRCRALWAAAEVVLTCGLARVEATSAVARAARGGRLTVEQRSSALSALDVVWSLVTVVPPDPPRLRTAAEVAIRRALRGYDAVHCAAALAVADDDLLAASGDQELLAAWRAEGLAVVDTTR